MVLAPLRHKPFGRLATAYTVNQVGDYVGLIALNVLVYEATGDPLAVAALLLGMQFLPAFVAPWLTAQIDHVQTGRALIVLYIGEGVLFGVLALLSQSFSLAPVLAVAFLDGVLMLTARGVIRASMNRILEPQGLLREGNALTNLGFAFAAVGGAALGGALVSAFDVTTALWVDAVSFLLVAVAIAPVTGLLPTVTTARAKGRLRAGLRYVRDNRPLALLLVGEGLAIVFFTITSPVQVVYANETIDAGDSGYAAMVASWGAGVLIGSLLFVRISRRPAAQLIVGSTLVLGLAFVGTGLARDLWLACLFSVLGGAGNGIQWVAVLNRLQEATPDEFQARLVGLLESIGSGAMGIGFLLGGALAALTSPPTTYLIAGAGVIALLTGYGLTVWPLARSRASSPAR